MNTAVKGIRKTRRQRDLERFTAMLRRPGARLLLMHTSSPTECSTETKRWFIVPGGQVPADIAEELKARPDVYGCADGLFSGCDQTWRFV
jgi:hypothetical protein